MQVYELLATYDLYLQTDQPLGKHAFQLVLQVSPLQRRAIFEVTLPTTSAHQNSVRGTIDPIVGLHRYQLVNAASDLYLPFDLWEAFAQGGMALFRAFVGHELLYLSIHASFDLRQQIIIHSAVAIADERSAQHRAAALPLCDLVQMGSLHGKIACVGSGAGLVLATADALQRLALDDTLSVRAFVEIEEAFLLSQLEGFLNELATMKGIAIIVVAMYTTFVPCEAIAQILLAFHTTHPNVKVIAHLEGVGAAAAAARLTASSIHVVQGLAMIAHAARVSSDKAVL